MVGGIEISVDGSCAELFDETQARRHPAAKIASDHRRDAVSAIG
jgi:hypothetical protein